MGSLAEIYGVWNLCEFFREKESIFRGNLDSVRGIFFNRFFLMENP